MKEDLTTENIKKDIGSFELVNNIIDFANDNMRNEFKESDFDAKSQVRRVLNAFKKANEEPEEEIDASE